MSLQRGYFVGFAWILCRINPARKFNTESASRTFEARSVFSGA